MLRALFSLEKKLFGIFSYSCHCLLNIIKQNKNTNGVDVTVWQGIRFFLDLAVLGVFFIWVYFKEKETTIARITACIACHKQNFINRSIYSYFLNITYGLKKTYNTWQTKYFRAQTFHPLSKAKEKFYNRNLNYFYNFLRSVWEI